MDIINHVITQVYLLITFAPAVSKYYSDNFDIHNELKPVIKGKRENIL
jgi:hypothetical protein